VPEVRAGSRSLARMRVLSHTRARGESCRAGVQIRERDYGSLYAGTRVATGTRFAYPVPPTVSASMRSVGCPTPTGTLCPSLPHVPMPSSSL
jgi:hypothetical protein